MIIQRSRRPLTQCLEKVAQSEAHNLQFPFLCPLVLPSRRGKRASSSNAQNGSEARRRPLKPVQQQQKASFVTDSTKLATATTSAFPSSGEDPIPFGPPPTSAYSELLAFGPEHIPSLHGFDLDPSPLVLNDTPVTSVGRYDKQLGVGGDINEIHQTLYACLQVGRLERAAVLVRRLNDLYKPTAPGLLAAHTDYLREATLDVIRSKESPRLKGLLEWFEKEIHKRNVPLNGTLLGLLVHACLQVPNKLPKTQTERHLYNLAKKAGVVQNTEEMVADLQEAIQSVDLTHEQKPGEEEESNPDLHEVAAGTTPAQLREVKLKGEGLRTLRKSLAFLHAPMEDAEGHLVDTAQLSNADKQRLLEKTTIDAAMQRWRIENEKLKKIGINSSLNDKSPVGAMMWTWYEQFVPAIQEELRLMNLAEKKDHKARRTEDDERVLCLPYLQQISPEKAAAVTIIALMTDLTLHGEVRLSTALTHLTAELQVEIHRNKDKRDSKGGAWRNISRQQTDAQDRRLKSAFSRFDFSGSSNQLDLDTWPQNVCFKIGAKLLSRLSKIAKVDVYKNDAEGTRHKEAHPALFHTFSYVGGKKTGVLRLNKVVEEKLQREPMGTALAKHLPMLCEPRPWQTYREGGFLSQDETVIRMHQADPYSLAYLKAASKNGDLDQVFEALNVLGKVPWVVNRSVFDVMAEVWNSGQEFAAIPAASPQTTLPPQPDSSDRKAYKAWTGVVTEVRHHVAGLKSKRAYQNFQLEVARAFLGQKFYFPHNYDFRGRAYPIPPTLNHMGPDQARGLLKFADGKKLGPSGLWWLKVHVANLYGFDKASFEERSKFADDHAEDISDSATNPLKGNRWWLKAEDPWQCLAACFELHAALQLPDPTEFVSHIPVHQDGTCNGLQHYAALGGDKVGAQQVNLEPGSRPSDIYSHVAGLVQDDIHQDALAGDERALIIDGRITRKVVKQTVMTNVYGVTLRGARDQVCRQLEDIFPITPTTTKKGLLGVADYVAKKIFRALSDMFGGAHDIQLWFGQCANRICESISPRQLAVLEQRHQGTKPAIDDMKRPPRTTIRGSAVTAYMTPVVWTTPLKLPVVQPYRISGRQRTSTEMQAMTLGVIDGASPVHKARQLQGFPPNFIHSLDGTHMILTALRCDQLGLRFAAVHDSFWTHACDVDTLNHVTRDAFIRMHAEDVIARLAAEFEARYKGHLRSTWIDIDHPAAEKILEWRNQNKEMLREPPVKANSKEKVRRLPELLLEGQRMRLLNSADPEEQRQGREMVTPASIVESFTDKDTLPESDPVATTTLGQTVNAQASKVPEDDVELDSIVDDVPEELETLTEIDQSVANDEAAAEAGSKPAKKSKRKAKVTLWTGLTFPPVPKKGEFDIRRLKDSLYFFS